MATSLETREKVGKVQDREGKERLSKQETDPVQDRRFGIFYPTPAFFTHTQPQLPSVSDLAPKTYAAAAARC